VFRTCGMVDIGDKKASRRRAVARGRIELGSAAFQALSEGASKKGDVLETAKIAAVLAAKNTPKTIPLCHPVLIESITVDFALNSERNSVAVTVTVASDGKTGVEMEALCGAAAACLTIYDMLKYVGKEMAITEICLLEKTGGKNGDYKRQD
jgi:cyclic pyranopterin monophosphate synthase